MKQELRVSPNAAEVIRMLKEAGYESYIVGGAVRDLLLGREPKDFDISTKATPDEVRSVFGRRSCRLIGKRFRLAHVYLGGELFEVSTFRRAPHDGNEHNADGEKNDALPEKLITSDNSFGTAVEDAWRRDFTVNALFYDPTDCRLIDHTGMGLADIERKVVRAIGNPAVRFEEDPVRMLRALKLVGQYDFALDDATENAFFASLPLIRYAAPSRLSLELEKILKSTYGDRHIQAFHDYGLLPYFLPEFNARWGTPLIKRALDLLFERNCRVEEGRYRNSVSLAMAVLAVPFVEHTLGREPGSLWDNDRDSRQAIRGVLENFMRPQTMMVRMRESAERILLLQPEFEEPSGRRGQLMQQRSYAHARELFLIRHAVACDQLGELEHRWPAGVDRGKDSPGRKRGGRSHRGRGEKKHREKQ